MAIQTPAPEQTMLVPTVPIWRLSVDQYHAMINAGILTDDDPIELLEGWLVAKMPQKPHHSFVTQLARDVLARVLPQGWIINIQAPIKTADSEPEPDICVVRGDRRDYVDRHPQPADVALVVEVSDATLQRDRTLKLRIYANARIPIYWILNLNERQLEVYTQPTGTGAQASYQQHVDHALADQVSVIIDGQEVGRLAAHDLLGVNP